MSSGVTQITDLNDAQTACTIIQIYLKYKHHKWQHKLQQNMAFKKYFKSREKQDQTAFYSLASNK